MNEFIDTSLTDYAFDELDAAARAEVERRLAADPAARAEVDELSGLARTLRLAIAPAGGPTIDAATSTLRQSLEQRLAALGEASPEQVVLESAPAQGPGLWTLSARWKALAGAGSLAALAASALFMALTYMPGEKQRDDLHGSIADRTSSSANREEVVHRLGMVPPPVTAQASAMSRPTVRAQTSEPPLAPRGNELPSVEQQNLSRYGMNVQPSAGRAESTESLKLSVPAPSNPQSGKANESAPALPPPATSPAGSVAASGPAPLRVDVGEAYNLFVSGTPLVVSLPESKGVSLERRVKLDLLTDLDHDAGVEGLERGQVGRKLAEVERRKQPRDSRREVEFDTEAYDAIVENPFLKTLDAPLSTFSIDVDTASYANVRRFLTSNRLPPAGAVRLEEFVNYFTYDYPQPTGDDPFSVTTEAARCPWNAEHVLVRVGLKGREIHRRERPATNLVFLVDVSGSMNEPNKLPLVRESLKMLTRELGDSDRVAIVVYAGSSGLVLDSTGGDRKQTIIEALDRLQAGGSTNGAAGIQLAYQTAQAHFIRGGVNRVVLATDGDFNVGTTSQDELVRLIEQRAKSGVFFSALGYGMGNLKDSTLEKLADKGNGNYAYIDTLAEARKVLVEQMSGTLVTIAKDVKIQIEFNPARVAGYRLLGYENRVLAAQDFNDDKKDAGEIGAGHTVTALYELIPTGKAGAQEAAKLPTVDPLKYQQPKQANEPTPAAGAVELLTLKLRYKQPDGDVSRLIERPLKDEVRPYAQAGGDFKFAASVAGFGMLLRQSQFAGSATFDAVLELAAEGLGRDEGGYRREFLELVRRAKGLAEKR